MKNFLKSIFCVFLVMSICVSLLSCGESKEATAAAIEVYGKIDAAYQQVLTAHCDIRDARNLAVADMDKLLDEGYMYFSGKLKIKEATLRDVIAVLIIHAVGLDVSSISSSDLEKVYLMVPEYFALMHENNSDDELADLCAHVVQLAYGATVFKDLDQLIQDAEEALHSFETIYPESKYGIQLENYMEAVKKYGDSIQEISSKYKNIISVWDTYKGEVESNVNILKESLKIK